MGDCHRNGSSPLGVDALQLVEPASLIGFEDLLWGHGLKICLGQLRRGLRTLPSPVTADAGAPTGP